MFITTLLIDIFTSNFQGLLKQGKGEVPPIFIQIEANLKICLFLPIAVAMNILIVSYSPGR
jgi:hypothetical protein